MARKPTFVLKEPKAKNETPIFMVYRIMNNRLKYSIGESIHPKHWDKVKQEPILEGVEDQELADRLEDILLLIGKYREKMKNMLRPFKYSGEPIEPEYIKKELDKEFRNLKDVPKKKINLIEWVGSYVDNVRLTRTDPPRPVSPETIRKQRIALKHLKDFAKFKYKGILTFDHVDMTFYDSYVEYLQIIKKQSINTAGKNIGILISWLHAATDEGTNKNLAFHHKKFKAFKEPVHHVYLTEEELDKIAMCDFTGKPGLERTRDLFLIGCRTALRYSDFTTLKAENFVNDLIHVITKKGQRDVYVPVHRQVKQIMEKYDYKLPPPISNQKFNENLKEVAKYAGINTPEIIRKTVAGKRQTLTFEKWQLVSSHTARRTAATNFYKAKMGSHSIMKITGHTTENNFLKYLKLTDREHAELMQRHDYFK